MFKKFFAVAVILWAALPICLSAAVWASSAAGNLVIKETDRVVLYGNVHSEVRSEIDIGPADESLPSLSTGLFARDELKRRFGC